jgi:hypothetical protein
MSERFQPGGVLHALVSGLLSAALSLVLLGCSLLAGRTSQGAAASLAAAALLWAVLALVGLGSALLRARVLAAELDGEGVTLHGVGGARRYRYQELSAVELRGGRARLVTRDGRVRRVRGVRGAAQAGRFRARVLARATEAAAAGPEADDDAEAGTAGAARLPGAERPGDPPPAPGPQRNR